jgi:hypothetical protein
MSQSITGIFGTLIRNIFLLILLGRFGGNGVSPLDFIRMATLFMSKSTDILMERMG